MPSFDLIDRPLPDAKNKNRDEEDVVSGAAQISVGGSVKMPPDSILHGESFGYTKCNYEGTGGNTQANSSISGSFPTLDSARSEHGTEVKRSSSNFSERNRKASSDGT